MRDHGRGGTRQFFFTVGESPASGLQGAVRAETSSTLRAVWLPKGKGGLGTRGKSRCLPCGPAVGRASAQKQVVGSEERTLHVLSAYFGNAFMCCREMLPPNPAHSPACPAPPRPVLSPPRAPVRPPVGTAPLQTSPPGCLVFARGRGRAFGNSAEGRAFSQHCHLHPFSFLS